MNGLNFQEKLVAQQGHLVHLVTGQDHTGRQAYYFLHVRKEKQAALERSLAAGHVNLVDFGTVIDSGYGDAVPEYVYQRLREKYGFS